ncbi:MAG: hypothetical protein ACFFEY_20405 [Candidatus Thorarchaeota archaeon]
MGVLMVTTWYPNHRGMEVAKWYLKQPKEIPHVTKWRVFNTPAGNDGMKQYHLIYTEKGKLEEASMEIYKYFTPIALQIEGYEITVELLIGVSDSYKMAGLKWE